MVFTFFSRTESRVEEGRLVQACRVGIFSHARNLVVISCGEKKTMFLLYIVGESGYMREWKSGKDKVNMSPNGLLRGELDRVA